MARGFMNGIIAGGIIGAIAGMYLVPQMNDKKMKQMLGRSRKIQGRAGKILKEVGDILD